MTPAQEIAGREVCGCPSCVLEQRPGMWKCTVGKRAAAALEAAHTRGYQEAIGNAVDVGDSVIDKIDPKKHDRGAAWHSAVLIYQKAVRALGGEHV